MVSLQSEKLPIHFRAIMLLGLAAITMVLVLLKADLALLVIYQFILFVTVRLHNGNSIIVIFSTFCSFLVLEQIINIIFSLPHYFLMIPSHLPTVFAAQILATLPLLLVMPTKKVYLRPAFSGRAAFYAIFAMSACIVIFGINGSISLGDYSTYRNNIAQGSGIIEYVIITFVILGAFRRDKYANIAFISLILLYTIKCVLLGFRIQAMMGGMVFWVFFMLHTSPLRTVMITFLAFFSAQALGHLKHSLDYLNTGFTAETLFLNAGFGYFETPFSGSMVSSTVGVSERYVSYFEAVLVIPASIFPRGMVGDFIPEAYPMSFIQNWTSTPGGILFGAYGYYFLGFLGAFIIGCVVAIFLKALQDAKIGGVIQFSAVVFFVFFPRWALYDFSNYGPRMAFTAFVLLCLLHVSKRRRLSRPAGDTLRIATVDA